jgi:hypothetical protein
VRSRSIRHAGIAADQRISQLEADLHHARRNVIGLMPDDIQRLLESYYSCTTRDERRAWDYRVVEQVIASAEIFVDNDYFGQRARCPLCRDSSTSPYSEGFSVPEGLKRHLIGWGNVRQCSVMDAACALAQDYWHRAYDASDRAEDNAKQAELEARRKSETLFQVAPDQRAKLVDEGAWFGHATRTDQELAWAEQRLGDLAFEIRSEDRIRSYVRKEAEFVVYADPRFSNRIDFTVHAAMQTPPTRAKSRQRARIGQFYLMDSWKRDLSAKFEARLADVVGRRASASVPRTEAESDLPARERRD